LHVVIVQGERAPEGEWQNAVASSALREYGAAPDLAVRVGLVIWGQRSQRVVNLTDDWHALGQQIDRAVSDPTSFDWGDPLEATEVALDILDAERVLTADGPTPHEVVIILAASKGSNRKRDQDLLDAANLVESRGARLLVGCSGRDMRCNTLRRMVDSAYYTEVPDRTGLSRLAAESVRAAIDSWGWVDLALEAAIPPVLSYLPAESITPAMTVTAVTTGTLLHWSAARLPLDAPSNFAYAVAPVMPGQGIVRGSGTLVDPDGYRVELLAPDLEATVSESCVVPTVTVTPSATDTATALPSAPAPVPAYLPVVRRNACSPGRSHADTLLVMDASTSMLAEVRPGYTKQDAARDAAAAFIDLLQAGDQAGLVSFSDAAVLEQELTADKVRLHDALSRIVNHQFTRLDAGIRLAHEELASSRHKPGNRAAAVVLTDGRVDPEYLAAAVEEARVAKSTGVTIFVVALGRTEDLDNGALGQIASHPNYYYQTSDAETLTAVYESIAGVIECPEHLLGEGRSRGRSEVRRGSISPSIERVWSEATCRVPRASSRRAD
jgi:Mg-chelatase subunit ChlD